MKSGLNRSLQYWFAISIFILVVISAVSYTIITNLLESRKLVDHSNEVILKLERVMSHVKDAETGQRGFLMHYRVGSDVLIQDAFRLSNFST